MTVKAIDFGGYPVSVEDAPPEFPKQLKRFDTAGPGGQPDDIISLELPEFQIPISAKTDIAEDRPQSLKAFRKLLGYRLYGDSKRKLKFHIYALPCKAGPSASRVTKLVASKIPALLNILDRRGILPKAQKPITIVVTDHTPLYKLNPAGKTIIRGVQGEEPSVLIWLSRADDATMLHEFVHAFLKDDLESTRWISEGAATYIECSSEVADPTDGICSSLNSEYLFDSPDDLDFSRGSSASAYQTARAFFDFLVGRKSSSKKTFFREFAKQLRETKDERMALLHAAGAENLEALVEERRAALEKSGLKRPGLKNPAVAMAAGLRVEGFSRPHLFASVKAYLNKNPRLQVALQGELSKTVGDSDVVDSGLAGYVGLNMKMKIFDFGLGIGGIGNEHSALRTELGSRFYLHGNLGVRVAVQAETPFNELRLGSARMIYSGEVFYAF